MKKHIYILSTLLSLSTLQAQTKYAAEKYFEDHSYVKAAEKLQKIYDKGKASDQAILNLADSYFYSNNAYLTKLYVVRCL